MIVGSVSGEVLRQIFQMSGRCKLRQPIRAKFQNIGSCTRSQGDHDLFMTIGPGEVSQFHFEVGVGFLKIIDYCFDGWLHTRIGPKLPPLDGRGGPGSAGDGTSGQNGNQ